MIAKARVVIVKGKRGKLERSFKHVAVSIRVSKDKGHNVVIVEMWFGSYKSKPVVRTVASTIKNMINGVTKGYAYKMKTAYAHFPINLTALNNGKTLEIKNFLGGRHVKTIDMLPGCNVNILRKCLHIEISGIDIENVSLTCNV